jgi:hypothetical protein
MGYQESFVTTTNKKYFNDFILRLQYLGFEYYNHYGTFPVHIVKVKENIYGEDIVFDNTVFEQGAKKIKLKKNTNYIFFTGERFLQGRPNRILNITEKADENWINENAFREKRLDLYPFMLKSVFAEEINGAKIFDTKENEDGIIYSGLNNEFITVTDFEFK